VLDKLPLLEAEYIETGKLKFVVHPFFLRPETMLPAEAAWCAHDQGKFFEYEHALYEKQGTAWGEGNLVELAGELGLNRETFAQCLSNRTHRAELQNAQRAAANRGVNATPIFFINNQRVEGNQPYEVFKQIIDQELTKAQ
jgi:protein-disulfide isomerase